MEWSKVKLNKLNETWDSGVEMEKVLVRVE